MTVGRRVVRLIGPSETDGEYVALSDAGSDEEIVHVHDYERLYRVPGLYEHIVQELLACARSELPLVASPREMTTLSHRQAIQIARA